MAGYGPEDDHFVVELTYNYGIKEYKLGNDFQVHTCTNLTTCQQDVFMYNRLVACLSTSCNSAVILSSCCKVVTHNLLTNC
jgi:hypothetical protein